MGIILGMRAAWAVPVIASILILGGIVPALTIVPEDANAQGFSTFFHCQKKGWDHSPTILIKGLSIEPQLQDFEAGNPISPSTTTGGVDLVLDAIKEYWLEGNTVDGESSEGSANSDFTNRGFGTIFLEGDAGAPTSADIDIIFVSTFSFNALCEIDKTTGHIKSATIRLTGQGTARSPSNEGFMNSVFWGGDETYKNAVAHELGHAIGLKHSGPPGTLMNTSVFGAPFKPGSTNVFHTAYMPLGDASQNHLTKRYG